MDGAGAGMGLCGGAAADSFAAAVAAASGAIDAAAGAHAPLRAVGSGGVTTSRRRVPPGSSDVVSRQLLPDQAGWADTVDGLLRALREGARVEAAAQAAERAAAREAEAAAEQANGRGLHSPTSRFDLSRFGLSAVFVSIL